MALVWANSPWRHSYESLWTTQLSITARRRRGRQRPARLGQRRADDAVLPRRRARGQARARRRRPARPQPRRCCRCSRRSAGSSSRSASTRRSTPAAPGAGGWGAAMSTDTALALGALALLTPRSATRLRVFLLSFAIVDDLVALLVIATVYTKHVSMPALVVAIAAVRRAARAPLRPRVAAPGVGAGRDRAVGGAVQVGHRPGDRRPRDRARDERLPALARGPRTGDVAGALVPRAADSRPRARSPAGRAGGDLARTSGSSTACTRGAAMSSCRCSRSRTRASTSAAGASATRSARRSCSASSSATCSASRRASWQRPGSAASRSSALRRTISWPVLGIGGTCRRHRLHGFAPGLEPRLRRPAARRREGRGARACDRRRRSSGWCLTRIVRRLPDRVRARQIAGTAEDLLDLAEDVDERARPHPRPRRRARHARRVRRLRVPVLRARRADDPASCSSDFGQDLRYVWRHLPLNDVHAHAQLAAEASEAAAAQGRFWDYYDALFEDQRVARREGPDHARRAPRARRRALHERPARAPATRAASPTTSRARTKAACRARRRSSSTAAATRAPYDIASLTAAVQAAKTRAGLLAQVGLGGSSRRWR